jgi:hypothetical protein
MLARKVQAPLSSVDSQEPAGALAASIDRIGRRRIIPAGKLSLAGCPKGQ